jgi:CHASE3 domain sensor protein
MTRDAASGDSRVAYALRLSSLLRPRTVRSIVQLVVIFLLVLLLLSAGGSAVARRRVAAAQHELQSRLMPAQQTAAELTKAYVDQETGQRGFLITGAVEFLDPYHAGESSAVAAVAELKNLLSREQEATRLVAAVEAAALDWRTQAAEPGITARRPGAIQQDRLDAFAAAGKARFDVLRTRLASLSDHVAGLVAQDLRQIASAQRAAYVVNGLAIVLALAVTVLSIPTLRRLITLPLERLVGQVQVVADGSYDRSIAPGGPAEINQLAEAVEKMRASLVQNSRELLAARHVLAVNDERARMAADLQERTIQRVFALGLMLSSAAARDPRHAQTFLPFVEETDAIIRELRSLIFDISQDDGSAASGPDPAGTPG